MLRWLLIVLDAGPDGVEELVAQNRDVLKKVLSEFAGLYQTLTEAAGVNVNLFQHSVAHDTPDACFPNNWFSTHAIGEARGGVTENTLVLYPMKTSNRWRL